MSADQVGRNMPGVTDLHSAESVSLAADQGGILRRQGALAEDAVGPFHQWFKRQARANERPEHGMQVRYEHGSSNAFAGNIAHHKVKVLAMGNQVKVITANHPGRFVVVRDLPTRWNFLYTGQQARLEAGSQFQVIFQGPLFVRTEAVQADLG